MSRATIDATRNTSYTMRNMTNRLPPKERQEQLLQAAVDEAVAVGYAQITRDGIAQRAGVTGPLVHCYFGTMANMRRMVMRRAVRDEILPIVAQGMAMRDAAALKAPAELQARARGAL